MIRTAAAQHQPLAALSYSWKAKGSAFLDLLDATDFKSATSSTHVQSELDKVRQQIAARRWQLATASTANIPADLIESTDPELQALERQLYDLRRRRNRVQTMTTTDLLMNPSHILAHMDADVLFEYVRCGDDLYGFYADRQGGCQVIWLTSIDILLDILDELHLNFQNVVVQPLAYRLNYETQWMAECLPWLKQCYDLLIAPLAALYEKPLQNSCLLLAPCTPLYLLPFAAFWDGAQYLIEACQIEMIQSGALLASSRASIDAIGPPIIIAASAEGELAATRAEASVISTALSESISLVDTPNVFGLF